MVESPFGGYKLVPKFFPMAIASAGVGPRVS